MLDAKELPPEVVKQIHDISLGGDSIRYLVNHLGIVKAKEIGLAEIVQVVCSIRGVRFEPNYRFARKDMKNQYGWENPDIDIPANFSGGEMITVDKTSDMDLRVPPSLPEQKTFEVVKTIVQGVAVNGHSDLNGIDFASLIPQNPPPYYPVRVAGKVTDWDIMVRTFEVCRCTKPQWYTPKGPDGKIRGLKFCRVCKRPNWRRPILLKGEQSTGKNTMIDCLAHKFQLPEFRIEFDDTTDESLLVGDVLPSIDRDTPFKFTYAALCLAAKYGGIFVGDEAFMIRAECSSILNNLLTPNGYIYVKRTNEIVRPHPNFWFIATGNEGYEGTKELNKALLARFRILEIEYNDNVDRKLTGDKRLVECARKLRNLYAESRIDQPVGPRDLIRFKEDELMFGTKVAIKLFTNKFGKDYRSIVIDALATIVPSSEIGVVEDEEKEEYVEEDDDKDDDDK